MNNKDKKIPNIFWGVLFIYLFIFREGRRKGEREEEKHQCVVASCATPAPPRGPSL